MKDKVAIIGYGYVGKAMHKIFPDALLYDVGFNMPEHMAIIDYNDPSALKANKMAVNKECALAIICVPTPMQDAAEGEEFRGVDTSIVEEVVGWLETRLILIKSTVPPGTTDRLNDDLFKRNQHKNQAICFSPEYVGEGKYQITPWQYMSPTDPRTHEFVIIGGLPSARDRVANYFVNALGPEKTYYLVDAIEAEIIKYMENSWGALKVIFANEFYQLCQKLGASYHRVREGWALDNRVERMHTAVFVDSQGFDGKCYPKDLNGIVVLGDQVGAEMSLIKAALRKNAKVRQE